MDDFVAWFSAHGGYLDVSSMALTEIPGHGRGAVALRDIPEGHKLFSIPRSLTLSTRTSSLPTILGEELWTKYQLNKGWAGLILCMMWEQAHMATSKWSQYLLSLPNVFDTPMFWNEDELAEIKGTAVVDKIGRDDAEKDYREKIVPTLQARPDVFPAYAIGELYSLEKYHIMGSRILSRSFHVERWESDEDGLEAATTATSDTVPQNGDAMDVDESEDHVAEDAAEAEQIADEDDEDDDETKDSGDVAMVPMADMLNARYGSENAKLFYEKYDLHMISTKPIQAGEQIWNTYGDLPNSDLLRRYGHVDLLPLPQGGEGNPADVVEVPATGVVDSVRSDFQSSQERIDWWLDEGGDDTFILETDLEVPESMIAFIRLLLLSQPDWEKTKAKGKPPKAKMDSTVASVAIRTLERRLSAYPTTLEEDERLLSPSHVGALSSNRKNAVIVRLGEKRVLHGVLKRLKGLVNDKVSTKRTGDEVAGGKRSKRTKQ